MKIVSVPTKGVDVGAQLVANIPNDGDYQAVAASVAAGVLGSTGAIGDRLTRLIIIPATTSPGAVSIQDGAGAAITVFTGGATSVQDLKPYCIDLGGLRSKAGAWKITTGAAVSVVAVGNFT